MDSHKTSHEPALNRLVTTRRAAIFAGGAIAAALLAACGNSGSKGGGKASDSGGSDVTPALPEPTQSAAVSVPFDESKPYLEFNPDSKGPAVELLVDYRCPHCKLFAEAQDKDIRELVEKGYINYRVYPRPMLDKRTGLTFSNDTASAVVASWVEDPKLFWDMNEAMFALQPESPEDTTPDTAEVAEAAVKAGASEEVKNAVLDEKYRDYVATVEAVGQERQVGTPTVYIDGEEWQGDGEQPGTLKVDLVKAIIAKAKK